MSLPHGVTIMVDSGMIEIRKCLLGHEYMWPIAAWQHERCGIVKPVRVAVKKVRKGRVGRPKMYDDYKVHRREYMKAYRAK